MLKFMPRSADRGREGAGNDKPTEAWNTHTFAARLR